MTIGPKNREQINTKYWHENLTKLYKKLYNSVMWNYYINYFEINVELTEDI